MLNIMYIYIILYTYRDEISKIVKRNIATNLLCIYASNIRGYLLGILVGTYIYFHECFIGLPNSQLLLI